MLASLFKVAWRNFSRNGWFTAANLFTMMISLACSILIFMWVYDEMSYDKFQANYNSIYQIKVNRNFKNEIFTSNEMVFPLADALGSGYPQIKYAVKSSNQMHRALSYSDNKFMEKGYVVTKNYFEMFSWKFIEGTRENALSDPANIVLTRKTARVFFGNEDAVGRIIMMDDTRPMKVSGIVEDPPNNSTFEFDFIATFDYSKPGIIKGLKDWDNSGTNVYVQIDQNSNVPLADSAINRLMRSHNHTDNISTYFVFPMSKWRLYSEFKKGKLDGGIIDNVRLFSAIGFLILLIACINFMNLSTARSEKRAKEVGVRKTLGSDRKQLILQFLIESLVMMSIAFLLAIISSFICLPLFNRMVDKKLSLFSCGGTFWIILIGIVFIAGILAGGYPAFYLSSFKPVKVLKGTFFAGRKTVTPRRVFLISQFVLSVFLLSGTVVIYQQLNFIKSRSLGYNPNNLIILPSSKKIDQSFPALKQDLLAIGLINSLTRSSSPVTEISDRSGAPRWEGKPPGLKIIFGNMYTDVDFTKTIGTRILEGNDFSGGPADSNSVLLNKSAVDAMQLDKPIGKILRYGKDKFTVIGVTDNMVMETPYKPVDPMIIYFDSSRSNAVLVRINNYASVEKVINALRVNYKKYDPALLFQYHFVDKEFEKKFASERLISDLANLFAALAILICLISLSGMTAFTVEKRFREIGIRKVMGASVVQILTLITKEFLLLLVLALVISLPLTWWTIQIWLKRYTFHISVSFLMFLAVSIFIILVTLMVVCLNSLKAAVSNPSDSIRTE